jgi:uncharacterized protein YcgL (UPF0745 family)
MNELIEMLSNFGFPIVAFLLVYIDLRKLVQQNTEVIENLIKTLNR